MQIASVRVENFRSFYDQTIQLNDYTCLVGPNGAGKSNVLTALNVFFRETENTSTDLNKLDPEDFHKKNTEEPIRITVTFTDLSDEAKDDFRDYVRQGQLVVSAEARYDPESGRSDVKQYGQRLGIDSFKPFFDAVKQNRKVSDLKKIYEEIRELYTELPEPSTKDKMGETLQTYEADHPDFCTLIPSEDHFYGFSKGENRLARHIQWIYVPAVKDASSEQAEVKNSALSKLLSRTVRTQTDFASKVQKLRNQLQEEYQHILDTNQNALDDLSQALEGRMSEWAHPDAKLRLRWTQDPEKSVRVEEPWAQVQAGEGDFEGDLARFGHGFQRSYLLALLQELARYEHAGSPRLILACEEPELYQHPPQARHLASVLNGISKSNAQVMVSSHDPRFVSGEGFEDVRLVRKKRTSGTSCVSHMEFDEISKAVAYATGAKPEKPDGVLAKIHQTLQPELNEMFFSRRLILVEGYEDVAYILTQLNLMQKLEEYRRIGCHIVPVNGKSALIQPLVVAQGLGIPTYTLFDADADKKDRNGSSKKHENDNRALLNVLGESGQSAMPEQTITGSGFTMWTSDIGKIVETEIGAEKWKELRDKADQEFGQAGSLRKNSLHIGVSLAWAWSEGRRSGSLESLCENIIDESNVIQGTPSGVEAAEQFGD